MPAPSAGGFSAATICRTCPNFGTPVRAGASKEHCHRGVAEEQLVPNRCENFSTNDLIVLHVWRIEFRTVLARARCDRLLELRSFSGASQNRLAAALGLL